MTSAQVSVLKSSEEENWYGNGRRFISVILRDNSSGKRNSLKATLEGPAAKMV